MGILLSNTSKSIGRFQVQLSGKRKHEEKLILTISNLAKTLVTFALRMIP